MNDFAAFLSPKFARPIIGRRAELEAIERALRHAREGRGLVLLVSGEPGIGKSRLIAETEIRAREHGFRLLHGTCFELDASTPFAPLVDLVQNHLATLAPEEQAAELTGMSGAVRQLMQGSAHLDSRLSVSPLAPEWDRAHLFHELIQFLVAPAAGRPTSLVVEDLQWCDDASLELLRMLTRRTEHYPLLLQLSYRSDEVGPALRHLLAEIDRGRSALDIALSPLTRADFDALLAAIVAPNDRIPAETREAIYGLTEGNPFFVEEVAKALGIDKNLAGADPRWTPEAVQQLTIPRSIEDAVLRRLERVGAWAQRVLTIAAIAGRQVDFRLLEALTGAEEGALVDALKELIAVQLIVEEAPDRFAFRHALARQAVVSRLLTRERAALHRQIAEALEGRTSESDLPDVTYHYLEGGVWQKTLDYSRQMGERASAMDAPLAAITHFTHALEASRHLGLPEQADLYRARGRAYEVRGEFDPALDDLSRAFDVASASGDLAGAWQGLHDLGFLWLSRDYGQAGGYFRDALTLARQMASPAAIAQSLNRLGNWHVNMDEPAKGEPLHEQALSLFREQDDQAGIAASLDLLAVATYVRGNQPRAIEHFEAAAAHFRALPDRRGVASVLATLAHLRCASRVYDTIPIAGRGVERALAECREALDLARAIGWRSGEAFALSELGACQLATGAYGPALTAARESLALAEEVGHGEWLAIAHSTLTMIALDLLDPRAATEHGERAFAVANSTGARHVAGFSAAFYASALLLDRQPSQAEKVLRDWSEPQATVATLTEAAVQAVLGEIHLARGEPLLALDIAGRLIAWTGQAGGPGVALRPWTLRGLALSALDRLDSAEAVLRDAVGAAIEQGALSYLWQLQTALGRVLRRQGRRTEAARAYAEARTVVDGLLASFSDAADREAFQRRVLSQLPAAFRLAQPPETAGGLTPREREVVTLIAQGYSNRQIAETLVVSERTVEAHTSHIRDKLGLTSRTEVAAWAVSQGLLSALDGPSPR